MHYLQKTLKVQSNHSEWHQRMQVYAHTLTYADIRYGIVMGSLCIRRVRSKHANKRRYTYTLG